MVAKKNVKKSAKAMKKAPAMKKVKKAPANKLLKAFVGTPHINAPAGAFAETVLLPGDPKRAEWIANTYLKNVKRVCDVRNMYGFTGTWQGKRVSVMGTGMGVPSISIYSTELVKFYGVKNLIRVGTCGSVRKDVNVGDICIGMTACTDSVVNRVRFATSKSQYEYAPVADWGLLKAAVDSAEKRGGKTHVGTLFTADLFYAADGEVFDLAEKYGILGFEMEASGLYGVAAEHGAKALAVCTVSDHIKKGEKMSPMDRQTSLDKMVRVGLDVAMSTYKK